MNTIDSPRYAALNAARSMLVRVSATLALQHERFVDENEPVDPRAATAAGKVEAALAYFDELRFGSHRYENQGLADAISCHQYRDDANHGGHYIPDHNKDHWGNLAARVILSAATLVETAPEV